MTGVVRIGVAVEAACDQYAQGEAAGGWTTGFVEDGVHIATGIPDWVTDTRRATVRGSVTSDQTRCRNLLTPLIPCGFQGPPPSHGPMNIR